MSQTTVQVHSVNEVTTERVNFGTFGTTTITATDRDGHATHFVLFHEPGVEWFANTPVRNAVNLPDEEDPAE